MADLIHELTHIGLTDKEAAVYLALLELGSATAQDIAKKANVNRATTYVMIESLATRGLASSFIKGKKRHFLAEPPERLTSMLQVQEQELSERQAGLSKMMPMLAAIHNVDEAKPQVRFTETFEGLKNVHREFESLKGDYVAITNFDEALAMFESKPEVRKEHTSRLEAQKDIYSRSILVTKNDPEEMRQHLSVHGGEVKFVSYDDFPIHGEIDVREDLIIMFSYKSALLVTSIRSKVIADTLRAVFEMAWEGKVVTFPTFEFDKSSELWKKKNRT